MYLQFFPEVTTFWSNVCGETCARIMIKDHESTFESPFDTLSDQVQMCQDLENSGTWRAQFLTKKVLCGIANFIIFLHMYYGWSFYLRTYTHTPHAKGYTRYLSKSEAVISQVKSLFWNRSYCSSAASPVFFPWRGPISSLSDGHRRDALIAMKAIPSSRSKWSWWNNTSREKSFLAERKKAPKSCRERTSLGRCNDNEQLKGTKNPSCQKPLKFQ